MCSYPAFCPGWWLLLYGDVPGVQQVERSSSTGVAQQHNFGVWVGAMVLSLLVSSSFCLQPLIYP